MMRHKLWLPRSVAARVSYHNAEPMDKTDHRRAIILHNEGVDRPRHEREGDFTWLADYVVNKRIPYHAIWNPSAGPGQPVWIQMIAFDKAARSMTGDIIGHGVSANRWGSTAIQICVAGFGSEPFTDLKKLKGVNVLADIANSWSVPFEGRKEWGPMANRSMVAWKASGFHGHCHAPGHSEDHTDPGPIDWPVLRRALT